MKYIIPFTFFIFSFFSFAQKIEIGIAHTLQSITLGEEREYWVYLPENYSDERYVDQHYPVIYLLDGEKYFHVASGIVKNISSGYYPQMPECILVAIKNTNRSRDLTPTKVTNLSYETGGATNFEAFITKELIPQINKNYRTLNYKILVGHSFGGLFTMNVVLKKTALFNAYIAIDPSLWWDDKLITKELENDLESYDFNRRILFFANANSIGNQKKPSEQHYSHFDAKKIFIEKLTATNPKNLSLNIQFYEDEDHGSVVLPSLIDGFRYVFKGFRINVKELMKNPELIQEKYQSFSDHIGYTFNPQSPYIDRVVDLLIKRGDTEKHKVLHQINIHLYPENIYLKNKLAPIKK